MTPFLARVCHLCRALVHANDHSVVTLERLKRKLLLGLDAHLPQLGDFLCEDGFGRGGGIDAVGLDGDYDSAANLEEEASVETDDTGLIGLGNVGEDAVNHAYEHAVLEGVTGNVSDDYSIHQWSIVPGVLNDGDDVCAVGGHVDQIASGAVREFDSEDSALWPHDVSYLFRC